MSNIINTSGWDEKELLGRLKEKQEAAYVILVRQFQEKLYRIAYGITQDKEESADIVQDVFLIAYKRIHTFRGEASLYTWLRRITVNQSLNWQRRWRRRFKWRHQSLEKEEIYDIVNEDENPVGPEAAYLKAEFKALLDRGLKQLPEDARAVFVLKEGEGLSYEEIAEVLNLKRGTVSSRLFYARQKLKNILSELLESED